MKKTYIVFTLLIILISFIAFIPVHAASEPIAHWKFDDGSGTAPIDSSSNNITASFNTPNPTWSTDVPSAVTFSDPYSLDFTGNHDGVLVSWPSSLNFGATAPRTFSFWYKPVANGETDGTQDRIISWTSDQFEISGTDGSSSTHKIAYYDGNWHSTSITLTLGTWYHITFTYDGTTAKFYVNDSLEDSHALAGRALSGTMGIGTRVQSNNEGINGKIDDVRIYNYALDATQVSNLTSGSNNPDGDPTSTPSPTPTATPTITPTLTPTSVPGSNTSSTTSSSTLSTPSCNDSSPANTPDLFQIDSATSQAVLYFSPANNADRYFISYGRGDKINQYGVEFSTGHSLGILSYTIQHLNPNTLYSFVIRGGNGCMPGNWGNTMQISTQTSSSKKKTYYKNFITQVLSFLPKQINKIKNNPIKDTPNSQLPEGKSCLSYTVQPGDSYWSIATSQLRNGNKFKYIMDKNNSTSKLLYPGQKLKIGC